MVRKDTFAELVAFNLVLVLVLVVDLVLLGVVLAADGVAYLADHLLDEVDAVVEVFAELAELLVWRFDYH